MLDKIQKALYEATEVIKNQAGAIGEGAKEKTYKLIEEWLKVFPKLELYGLEITSFSLGVALSPSLDVELIGKHENFSPEKIQKILAENKGNTAMFSVFNTMKMTYNLYRKTYGIMNDPLIVKIKIRISPEIKIYIGQPLIE